LTAADSEPEVRYDNHCDASTTLNNGRKTVKETPI